MTTGDGLGSRWRPDPLALVWLLLPFAVWGSHGFHNLLARDAAFYVYAGQIVADGVPPYVGLMNRVGPLSHLLPGLGVWLAREFGGEEVVGVRIVFFVLTALTPVLVYLVARSAFRSRVAACVGAAALLAFEGWALNATNGPQSKQPMVTFLLLALLFSMKRQMLLAGVATGLATLTWQPVLFAAAAAALVMGLTSPGGWRPRAMAVGWYALGGAITLAVTVAYFTLAEAFGPFLDGFVLANAGYTVQRDFFFDVSRSWGLLSGFLGWTTWLFLAGLALWLPVSAWVLRPAADEEARKQRHRTLALAASAGAAVGWTLWAYSGAADTMLVLPAAALGLSGGAALLAHAARRWTWSWVVAVAAATAWVVAATAVTLDTMVTTRTSDLDHMASTTRAAFAQLPDDATFITSAAPQPLALAGERNLTRYVLYGNGMASWIDHEWPGGRKAYAAWVQAQQPTVLLLPRQGGMPPFMEPMLLQYTTVGHGFRWRVMLHRSVDPVVRERVAEALADGTDG